MGHLEHIADRAVEPELTPLAGVAPVDQHAAGGRFEEAADQVHEGALARAGLADDRDVAAEGDLQAEVLEHVLIPVRIAEGDILKGDITADGLPVLPPGVKGIAVFFNDFRRIRDIGRGAEEAGEPLNVHLGGDDVRDRVHDPADRFHHALSIGHEHREGADLRGRDEPALPQDDRQGQGGGHVHRDGEPAAKPGCAHGRVPVFLGVRDEVLRHAVLNGEGLDGLRAGNRLVEIPGDARVQLPDLPVGEDQLPLEKREKDHHERQDRRDHEGQADVDDQHHRHRTDQVAGMPDAVHERPGDQTTDAGGIRHDARMDIADTVLVKIGKGQRLQVVEGRVAQVPVHGDLSGHGALAGDESSAARGHDRQDIDDNKQGQGIGGAAGDEMVQGIALKEGQGNIHSRPDQAADHHRSQGPAVFPGIGHDARDTEERQGGFFFFGCCYGLDHAGVTSFRSRVWISSICRYRPGCALSSAGVPNCATRPQSITRTRSALDRVVMRWEIRMIVAEPKRFSSSARMRASVSVSTAESESSKIMMGVGRVSIRAIAARCFWPPDRVTPRSPTKVS